MNANNVNGDILSESINIAFTGGAGDYGSEPHQDDLVDDQETGCGWDNKYPTISYNMIDE